ncbi:MAG TPA: DNA damage-inducible protein D [Terracidiphilus sp.]|nr:DNA damage-inducible protein D [Terracidiphilus sp.]
MEDATNLIIGRLKALRKTSQNGNHYWIAREIMTVLDYSDWRDFRQVIERAKASCENAGNFIADHFVLVHEMVVIGSGAKREVDNFALSKYACYLIAMNGDTVKSEIAAAQAYFVEQTYRQEDQERLTEEERRLLLRARVKDANRKLSGAAKDAGVRSKMFGIFQDAGYKGLYEGRGVRSIKQIKGIDEKEDLLDCIGRAELAANEFRITQTEEKLRIEGIKGEQRAIDTHLGVGKRVRQAIKDIGGTMPERLPAEPSIKKLSKKNSKPLKGSVESSRES